MRRHVQPRLRQRQGAAIRIRRFIGGGVIAPLYEGRRRLPRGRLSGLERPCTSHPTARMKRDGLRRRAARCSRRCVQLWPYIWPSDRRDLKLRVLVATVLLLAAKLATIAVPFTFKWATDALTGQGTRAGRAADLAALGARRADRDDARLWRHAHPDGGCSRRCATACSPRSRCTRCAGSPIRTFEHMHELSLRFHLERKTGGLTRVLERGRNAHRDHRAHGDPAARADHRRARADRRRAALAVRLALRAGRSSSPSRSTCRSPTTRPSGASASAAR